MEMLSAEIERSHPEFRGSNNKRMSERDVKTLIVDTIDVGLYGQITPDNKIYSPQRTYLLNQELWSDLLASAVGHGDTITLERFEINEWLPICPGRYFTKDAVRERKK